MRTAIIVSVTPEGNLELPPEIREKIRPGDEYLLWQTEDSILLKKIQKPLDWEELRRRRDAIGPDPNELTMEEICEIVREVRRERSKE